MSTAAITISNVLRVQSRLRVPRRNPPAGNGIYRVNLVSPPPRAASRTRNTPPLISRSHLRRTPSYLHGQVHSREARAHARPRRFARQLTRGRSMKRACARARAPRNFERYFCHYYLSQRMPITHPPCRAKYFITRDAQ